MKQSELLGHLRCSVLRDIASPQLWSDTELIRFLDEAYRNFARRTFCLSDDTSEFTTFPTVVGQQEYELDPRILRIEEAGIIETDTEGRQTWHPMRDGTRGQVSRMFYEGRPTCYGAQVATKRLRLSPVPNEVYVVQLRVMRLPLKQMTRQTMDMALEIPEDYQLMLADYAAWRALRNNDPEGANMAASQSMREGYEKSVRAAKRDYAHMHAGESPLARANWTGKTRYVRL